MVGLRECSGADDGATPAQAAAAALQRVRRGAPQAKPGGDRPQGSSAAARPLHDKPWKTQPAPSPDPSRSQAKPGGDRLQGATARKSQPAPSPDPSRPQAPPSQRRKRPWGLAGASASPDGRAGDAAPKYAPANDKALGVVVLGASPPRRGAAEAAREQSRFSSRCDDEFRQLAYEAEFKRIYQSTAGSRNTRGARSRSVSPYSGQPLSEHDTSHPGGPSGSLPMRSEGADPAPPRQLRGFAQQPAVPAGAFAARQASGSRVDPHPEALDAPAASFAGGRRNSLPARHTAQQQRQASRAASGRLDAPSSSPPRLGLLEAAPAAPPAASFAGERRNSLPARRTAQQQRQASRASSGRLDAPSSSPARFERLEAAPATPPAASFTIGRRSSLPTRHTAQQQRQVSRASSGRLDAPSSSPTLPRQLDRFEEVEAACASPGAGGRTPVGEWRPLGRKPAPHLRGAHDVVAVALPHTPFIPGTAGLSTGRAASHAAPAPSAPGNQRWDVIPTSQTAKSFAADGGDGDVGPIPGEGEAQVVAARVVLPSEAETGSGSLCEDARLARKVSFSAGDDDVRSDASEATERPHLALPTEALEAFMHRCDDQQRALQQAADDAKRRSSAAALELTPTSTPAPAPPVERAGPPGTQAPEGQDLRQVDSSAADLPLRGQASTAGLPLRGRASTTDLPLQGRASTAGFPLRGQASTADLGQASSGSFPLQGQDSTVDFALRGQASTADLPSQRPASPEDLPLHGQASNANLPSQGGQAPSTTAPLRGQASNADLRATVPVALQRTTSTASAPAASREQALVLPNRGRASSVQVLHSAAAEAIDDDVLSVVDAFKKRTEAIRRNKQLARASSVRDLQEAEDRIRSDCRAPWTARTALEMLAFSSSPLRDASASPHRHRDWPSPLGPCSAPPTQDEPTPRVLHPCSHRHSPPRQPGTPEGSAGSEVAAPVLVEKRASFELLPAAGGAAKPASKPAAQVRKRARSEAAAAAVVSPEKPGKRAAAAARRLAEEVDPSKPLPAHKDPRAWRTGSSLSLGGGAKRREKAAAPVAAKVESPPPAESSRGGTPQPQVTPDLRPTPQPDAASTEGTASRSTPSQGEGDRRDAKESAAVERVTAEAVALLLDSLAGRNGAAAAAGAIPSRDRRVLAEFVASVPMLQQPAARGQFVALFSLLDGGGAAAPSSPASSRSPRSTPPRRASPRAPTPAQRRTQHRESLEPQQQEHTRRDDPDRGETQRQGPPPAAARKLQKRAQADDSPPGQQPQTPTQRTQRYSESLEPQVQQQRRNDPNRGETQQQGSPLAAARKLQRRVQADDSPPGQQPQTPTQRTQRYSESLEPQVQQQRRNDPNRGETQQQGSPLAAARKLQRRVQADDSPPGQQPQTPTQRTQRYSESLEPQVQQQRRNDPNRGETQQQGSPLAAARKLQRRVQADDSPPGQQPQTPTQRTQRYSESLEPQVQQQRRNDPNRGETQQQGSPLAAARKLQRRVQADDSPPGQQPQTPTQRTQRYSESLEPQVQQQRRNDPNRGETQQQGSPLAAARKLQKRVQAVDSPPGPQQQQQQQQQQQSPNRHQPPRKPGSPSSDRQGRAWSAARGERGGGSGSRSQSPRPAVSFDVPAHQQQSPARDDQSDGDEVAEAVEVLMESIAACGGRLSSTDRECFLAFVSSTPALCTPSAGVKYGKLFAALGIAPPSQHAKPTAQSPGAAQPVDTSSTWSDVLEAASLTDGCPTAEWPPKGASRSGGSGRSARFEEQMRSVLQEIDQLTDEWQRGGSASPAAAAEQARSVQRSASGSRGSSEGGRRGLSQPPADAAPTPLKELSHSASPSRGGGPAAPDPMLVAAALTLHIAYHMPSPAQLRSPISSSRSPSIRRPPPPPYDVSRRSASAFSPFAY
ncbi:Muscle M-line assembly protein unc-89 [Diplonema papillatum]|nr:Muscle M-line assembly protein unc-89 [Diplonema papillatum]